MYRFIVSLVISLGLLSLGMVAPGVAVAQEATPAAADQFPISPDPAQCTGEEADVEQLLNYWYDAEGTPIAVDSQATHDAGTGITVIPVPVGQLADDATRNAVIETVTEVFACFAAGDVLRGYALFSQNLARQFGPEPGTPREDAEAFLTMAPQPEAEEEQSLIVTITDVMTLADGRAGAFVVERSGGVDSTGYAILVQEGDRWLVDEIIEFSEPGESEAGTPTP